MKRCPDCGNPDPGTGELFLVTGFTDGQAWSWSAKAPDEPPVWGPSQVPVVEPTCRCER